MRGLVLGVVTVLRAVARGGVEAENAATEELGLLKIRDSSVEATDPRAPLDSLKDVHSQSNVPKVIFSLLYPTLSHEEPIWLPEELSSRDEAQSPSLEGPQSIFLRMPPRVTISYAYKVHVASDCHFNRCDFRPLIVYIQPTNWFVEPEKASLESLMKALKTHALHLLRVKRKASRLHRNLLVRSPKSWLSNMKAKLTAEIGSVCFMQPTISQKRRGAPKVKLLRVHKHARLNSLFDTTQKHQVLISATSSLPLKTQVIDLRDTGIDNEEYSRASEQAPQNVFGLCRSPRNNMLRRLAEKGFVLCTVVLRKDAHVVDRCEDLPVDDIHTMQAVQRIHRNLADPSLPMLGYVPTTLPAESPQRLLTILKDLERTVPPATYEEAITDNCVTHISQELREVENSHILELWNTAEMKKAVNSELLLRSMVKFAHFNLREIAPESAPEYRLSLIKLANKWTRTTELIRKFNEAVASCPSPTIRPIYFPQYESKILPLPHESVSDLLFQLRRLLSIEIPPIHRLLIGGAYLFSFTLNQRDIAEGTSRQEISGLVQDICKLLTEFASLHLQPKAKSYVEKYLQEVSETANRLLDIALNIQAQWRLIRTILVTPFWIFAFGRHCGPADKQTAFELGYGLCPYHLLSFFFKEAAAEATKQPGLQNWAIRFIGKWAKSIEAQTLPEMAGEPTEVFLEQQVQNLPQLHPDLFYSRGGKIFKVSPFQK